jgi:hypothetical protein
MDPAEPEDPWAGDETRERARKVKPQYGEGPLVWVAGARNQTEAEFIQGLLLEEGVPSLIRRARGFDVPDFLAAGPRELLVPQSGAEVARQVLLESDLAGTPAAGPDPRRLAIGVAIGLLIIVVLAVVGVALS